MRGDAAESKLTRGALTDAPRRDTTMTQDSDSGDARSATRDLQPTQQMMTCQGKNRLNQNVVALGNKCRETFG
jgi:hypothetical protein